MPSLIKSVNPASLCRLRRVPLNPEEPFLRMLRSSQLLFGFEQEGLPPRMTGALHRMCSQRAISVLSVDRAVTWPSVQAQPTT